MESKDKLNVIELEDITGGETVGVNGFKLKVLNPSGASIHMKADKKSQIIGCYSFGTTLKNCDGYIKGTDGKLWVYVPSNLRQPAGYVQYNGSDFKRL